MSIQTQPFGQIEDGAVTAYTLTDQGGLTAEILNYGGIVRRLLVPLPSGESLDVVLGYDHMAAYQFNPYYFGALIGRCANRIAEGQFTLDGKSCALAQNASPCHLHGGEKGFDKRIWDAAPSGDTGLKLQLSSPDGEEGYPGRLDVTVTYRIEGMALIIEYAATTDAPTIVNLTHHSYFNLAGRGDVHKHRLTLDCDQYTPMKSTFTPTGELSPVTGTPFDFTVPHAIGQRINDDDDQLKLAHGYDHNFVIRRTGEGLARAGEAVSPESGVTMEVWTTEPGVQFYAGNFVGPDPVGKRGLIYGPRSGFCLETQHFPDAPNLPQFPSIVLRPGETFTSRTEYRFSV